MARKEVEIAYKTPQIKILEAKIEELQPRKRRKVHPDLNSTPTSIKGSCDTQVVVGAIEIEGSESPDVEDHDDIFDCIEVINLAEQKRF